MTDIAEPFARRSFDRTPDDGPSSEIGRRIRRRALLLWPRLDRARLARTAGDPQRIARLVARRSSLPSDVIVAMLTAADDRD